MMQATPVISAKAYVFEIIKNKKDPNQDFQVTTNPRITKPKLGVSFFVLV